MPEITRIHPNALFFSCDSLIPVAYDLADKVRAGMPIDSTMQNSRISHQPKNGRKPRAPAMQKLMHLRYPFTQRFPGVWPPKRKVRFPPKAVVR